METSAAIFITIPYSVIKTEAPTFETQYGVNILIDTVELNPETILDYIRRSHRHFIFSLSEKVLNSNRVSSILPLLYTIFSLGSYGKSKNYVPVFCDAADTLSSSLVLVKNYFKLQGEKSVDFFEIPGLNNDARIVNETLICHFTQLKQMGEQLFKKYEALNVQQVILVFDRFDSIVDNSIALQLLMESNNYVKSSLEFAIERSRTMEIACNSELWKKRAKLYLSFIPLSKKIGESQYFDILDWYKKEYEILPVWYKRFGHIIKVLMGKRTFRSLFDKNVSKYKE